MGETRVMQQGTSQPHTVHAQDITQDDGFEGLARNQGEIRDLLNSFGSILFRGLGIKSPEEFRKSASLLCPSLHEKYADLPAIADVSSVYQSTPYPAEDTIQFHNEGAHLTLWPTVQFFYCQVPAASGGETDVADGRAVGRELPPEIMESLSGRGLMYVRHFHAGVDVPWQDFFRTNDPDEAVATCAKGGMRAAWLPSGALRVIRDAPAIQRHSATGGSVLFHQILLFHQAMLDPDTRDAINSIFPEDEPPREVRFGDGSPIPDKMALTIRDVYHRVSASVSWQPGDLLMIDNELVAHSRRPYGGSRQLFVAMGGMRRGEKSPDSAENSVCQNGPSLTWAHEIS
jgi:hypothetical protein